jgi:hypothetical protein
MVPQDAGLRVHVSYSFSCCHWPRSLKISRVEQEINNMLLPGRMVFDCNRLDQKT